MMRYADIISSSIVDGPGIRVVAFLQGCPRSCEGCHNPNLLSVEGGIEVSEEDFVSLLLEKITPLHKGITFSGGDPLMQPAALLKVISIVRKEKPEIDIWVYTGYDFEKVKDWPVMKLVDVLVDGPFILEKRDIALAFRGSANQRIINVPESIKKGEVVEYIIQ